MFEASRAAQSAAGPEIDRLRHREAELLREVRSQNNVRASCSVLRESDKPGIPWIQDIRRSANANYADEVMQTKASAAPPSLTRSLEAMIESQKYENRSLQRNLTSIRFKVPVLMKVLLHRHHPAAEIRNQQSVIYHKIWRWPRAVPAKRAHNAQSSMTNGCSFEYNTSEQLESTTGCTQLIYSCDFLTDWSNSHSPWLWRTHFLSMYNRKPFVDFENFDFEIASGLWQILTRNFKKQVTTSNAKFTYRQTDCLDVLRLLQN